MGSVEFFDHLHAGAAVLGDLIDVGTLHESHADVGVPEAVGRAPPTITVEFQIQLVQNSVEHITRGRSENLI